MNPQEFIQHYEQTPDDILFPAIENYVKLSPYGKDLRNLLQRMDYDLKLKKRGRSLVQFLSEIKSRTYSEHLAISTLRTDIISRGHTCDFVHNGVDPNGELVISKKHIGKSDYILYIDHLSIEVDMKKSPVKNKATFKVDELQRVLRNRAHIILFIGAGFKDEYLNKSRWTIFGKQTIESLLELPSFNFAPFGNKRVVMVKEKEFNKFFNLYTIGGKEHVRLEFD